MIAFILGVANGSFFDIPEEFILIIAIVAVSIVAIFYRRGSRILSFPVAFVAFFILAFSAGILRFEVRSILFPELKRSYNLKLVSNERSFFVPMPP